MEPIALPPDMGMIETQSDKLAGCSRKNDRMHLNPPDRAPAQLETVIADEPLQQVETRKE